MTLDLKEAVLSFSYDWSGDPEEGEITYQESQTACETCGSRQCNGNYDGLAAMKNKCWWLYVAHIIYYSESTAEHQVKDVPRG